MAALRCRRLAALFAATFVLALVSLSAAGQSLLLSGVPGYEWYYGCSPTAGMMVLGYWDTLGHPDLITGSNSWFTNKTVIKGAIASPEHISDYSRYNGVKDEDWEPPYPDLSSVDPGSAHADNCLADFMLTSRSAIGLSYGKTYSDNIGPGLVAYGAYRGYTAGMTYTTSPAWDAFVKEIESGRPVMLSVDSEGNGEVDHSVTAFGYRMTNGYTEYICRDTWSTGWRWERFRAPSGAYEWGVGGMTTFRPNGTWQTADSGTWHDALTWDNGVPGSDTFTCIPFYKSLAVQQPAAAGYLNNLGTLSVENSLTVEELAIGQLGALSLGAPGSSLAVSQGVVNRGAFTQTQGLTNIGGDFAVKTAFNGFPSACIQSGGTIHVGGAVQMYGSGYGFGEDTFGTYTLSAGHLEADGGIEVGGDGRFEWKGGSIKTPKVSVGKVGAQFAIFFDLDLADLANGNLLGGTGVFVTTDNQGVVVLTGGSEATLDSGSVPVSLQIGDPNTGSAHLVLSGTGALRGAYGKTLYISAGQVQQFGGSVGVGDDYYSWSGYVGVANGCTYELHGGEIKADKVGTSGLFLQYGGSIFADDANLSTGEGNQCRYELNDGSLTVKDDERVRIVYKEGISLNCDPADALFIQRGGTHTVKGESGWLMLDGTYRLEGGQLTGDRLDMGWQRSGVFVQEGGTSHWGYLNVVGYETGGYHFVSTYEMKGGSLRVGQVFVGGYRGEYQYVPRYAPAEFIQTGGSVTVTDTLDIGAKVVGAGYTISDGTLETLCTHVGAYGEYYAGTFTQTGGTHQVIGDLVLAERAYAEGTYRLLGGSLLVGGDVRFGGGAGTFVVDGGSLVTGRLLVQSSASAESILNFNSPTSYVEVAETLKFGRYANFHAIPGAKIHMTGAAFENESTDPAALAGLANLELIFEGGPADLDPFEVASAVGGGFDLNFALGTLTVGGADVGCVQLVDMFDNGNRGTFGAECLFAHTVNLQSGSTLDLNGLRLYVEGDVESMLDGCVADGRLLDGTGALLDAFYRPGNDWTVVPEPATLALLALGVTGLILKRRRPVA